MDPAIKEQKIWAENYLRYLFGSYKETDTLRMVVEKELMLFAGKAHPLFHGGGAPSVAIKVKLGNPTIRSGPG